MPDRSVQHCVGWLNDETGVQHALGGRVRDPPAAVADAMGEHLRQRFGEPVQKDLAKGGWRRHRDRQCRPVHVSPNAEPRLIPRAPVSMDTGIGSGVGWINLPTLFLRRFASFDSCCRSRSGDPKGGILRVSVAVGFILALPPWWANPPADAGSPTVGLASAYSQGTDPGRVNYARNRRCPSGSSAVPEPNRPPPAAPPSPFSKPHTSHQSPPAPVALIGDSQRAQTGRGYETTARRQMSTVRQPGRSGDPEGGEALKQQAPAVALGRGIRGGDGQSPLREAGEEEQVEHGGPAACRCAEVRS